MKTTILILAAAASSVMSLQGQIAMGAKLTANVPFAFHQGNSPMPAGRYEITAGPAGAVVVNNRATRQAAISVYTNHSVTPSATGYLRFHCFEVAGQCFLREVAAPDVRITMAIGESKLEKELGRTESVRVAIVEADRTHASAE